MTAGKMMTGGKAFIQFEEGGKIYPLGDAIIVPPSGLVSHRYLLHAISTLIESNDAARFGERLHAMNQALQGPQEWVLNFDGPGFERLCEAPTVSDSDLWALATLISPDGDEWRTTDGENWTCGDRRMIL